MANDERQISLSSAASRMQFPAVRTTSATRLLPMLLLLWTLPAAVRAEDFSYKTNNGTITTGAAIANPDTISNTDPAEIKTLDGKTYKPVRIVRVMPDGLVVEFSPPGGGVAMAELRFDNLPANLRQRYRHDSERATELAQEQGKLAAQYWADYKDATNRMAIQLAKEEAEEHAEAERVRIAKEKADAERRRLEEEQRKIDATAIGVQRRDETNPPPYVQPVGPYGRQLRGTGQR